MRLISKAGNPGSLTSKMQYNLAKDGCHVMEINCHCQPYLSQIILHPDTNCRRISGGHIAQVALLPLKIWGGGPPGPWEIPCPGPRKETCFSSIFKQPKIVLLLIKFKNLSSSDFFYRYHNHTIFKSFL